MIRRITQVMPALACLMPFASHAEIIQIPSSASAKNAPSQEEIIRALIKPAVPNPIPVDTAKEDANITAKDFRHFAPLYEALKKSPEQAKALAFFVRHRGRMIGAVDRRAGTDKMVQEFKKLFPDIRSAPTPLRIGVAAAWTRAITAHKSPEAFADALFTESDKDSPIVRALLLAEKLRYAQHSRAESVGKGRMDTMMDCHRRLRETLNSIDPKELAALSDDTLMAILNPLVNDVEMESLKNPAYTLLEQEVIKELKAIPANERRAPHEAIIGKYYTTQAWFRRGGGWANETDPNRLEDFETLLAKAGSHYRASLKKNPEFLPAAQGLLRIAGSDSGAAEGDENYWYAVCEKIAPNDAQSARYYIRASSLLWGKSPINLLAFAKRAVREARYDTPIPLIGVEALEMLLQSDDSEALRKLHARTTLTVFNRYLYDQSARKPRVVDEKGNSLMAYQKMHAVTHLTKTKQGVALIPKLHRESVDASREKVVDHLIANHLENLHKPDPVRSPGRLLEKEYNSNAADEELIIRFNDPEWIRPRLKQAEADAKRLTDINNASCFRRFIPRLRESVDFIDGKAVTLGVDGPDSFHATSAQDWNFQNGGMTAKNQGAPTSLYGTLIGWLKPPYEVTLRIRENTLPDSAMAGLHVGRSYSGTSGRSFVINPKTGEWRILTGKARKTDAAPKASGKVRTRSGVTTVTARVLPHGYTLLIDGVAVHSGGDEEFRPGAISVGTPPLIPTTGSLTMENPVVRSLSPKELSPAETAWMRAANEVGYEEFFGEN